jgi:RNA polymerase sigma-70 factor (sigma-E family)
MEPSGLGRSGRAVTTSETDTAGPELSAGFDAFYGQRFRDAVRLAYVITGDPDRAEDIAQVALMRVWARFHTLREPWPYARTAIINAARSDARRRRRERVRLEVVATSEPISDVLPPIDMLDAIDRLPFRQKAVVVLRYYEDLSEREIAEALGCRPGTVKSLASRALARLAQEVKR